jgi:hypothetical protein
VYNKISNYHSVNGGSMGEVWEKYGRSMREIWENYGRRSKYRKKVKFSYLFHKENILNKNQYFVNLLSIWNFALSLVNGGK